jgi:outer membrane scaffolding protein for murein synthesis (MipA/OmpV family)
MTFKRCFLALAFVSSGALAQADSDNLLGAAERSRPQYDGSDRQTTDAIPLIRYARGPWFVRTLPGILEGGGHLRVAGGVLAGLQLAHEAGPLDGDPGASLGAHVEWTTRIGRAPLNALARIRQHLDADRGRQLDARLTLGVYGSGEVRAGIFGGATWASEKHLLAYYDVPGSGLQYTSAGALGSYKLTRSWLAVATAELRRLADKPSQSAFVQERTNAYMNLGVAYRF